MNIQVAKILCAINNDFYAENHASFSATRQHPWTGWQRSLDVLREDLLSAYPLALPDRINDTDNADNSLRRDLQFSVFDLASGNMRFEAFLTAALPKANITFYAMDNCDKLVLGDQQTNPLVNYQSLDILDLLQSGNSSISEASTAPRCDLSVCFGFMHHVPLQKWRESILQSLVEQTRSGGYVVTSFWQFLNNQKLAQKARQTHQNALLELGLQELAVELDDGDCLLGWKDVSGAYRYCHSFSEPEIDQIVNSLASKATLVSRFVSDGRTDNLNSYLVLKVK